MSLGGFILATLFCVVVLPVVTYMVVKFGAAGYFRAKRQETKTKTMKHNE